MEPSDPEDILKAREIIEKAISVAELETGQFGLKGFTDARQAILEIGSRHPLRHKQAIEIEKEFHILGVVNKMLKNKELISVYYNSEKYLLPGHFTRKR